jgi:bacillithiol biosynthesis cysteine-adding enzyme BshC
MYINFSDLPAHENLFLDYLHEYENVERYYSGNFRNPDIYPQLFNNLAARPISNRTTLIDILKLQYKNLNISSITIDNINSLADPNTITVVTGQQLGLFGGPLYTFYKTITAIKLCSQLKDSYPNYNFVPVFWLEGDDHDFEEVKSLNILNNENNLVKLSYEDGLEEEINRGSIAALKFNDNLIKVFESLKNELRGTEFKQQIIELLEDFYKPGKTFLESFRDLLIYFFDKHGLVVCNPNDPLVKELLKPIFKDELINFDDNSKTLVERSAELEEIYHAQVKVKAINLFYLLNNERISLEPGEDDFKLKGKRKRFSKEELFALLESNPENFSPNVLLRPVCQDYLFNTAFYIAGPGEISYFAQVSPLYKYYDIQMPIIYPRASATIVERGVQGILEKFDLSFTEIILDENELINKILASNSDQNISELFNVSRAKISETFEELGTKLIRTEKTLIDLVEKTKQKIDQSVDMLEQKSLDAHKRKYETTLRQLSKVRNVLFPNGILQERELNFIYFCNKYGLDFVKLIFEKLEINIFEHQIINLE